MTTPGVFSRQNLLTIYLPSIAMAAGSGIAAPALPVYAKSFDVGFGMAALILILYEVGSDVATIPIGHLVDRFGRRPMLLSGPVLIATGKAWGSLGMGSSSRSLGERLKDRPSFLAALSDMSDGKVVPVAGGVLVLEKAELVGAVGISGASSDEDEECAVAGIKAAGLEAKV